MSKRFNIDMIKISKVIRKLVKNSKPYWPITAFFTLSSYLVVFKDISDLSLEQLFLKFLGIAILLSLGLFGIKLLVNNVLKEQKIILANQNNDEIEIRQKILVLKTLIDDLSDLEKTLTFMDNYNSSSDIKALIILPVERAVGVILNIGKNNGLKEGTKFLYSELTYIDETDESIETPLAIIQITLVQMNNNCSQGIIDVRLNKDHWAIIGNRLEKESKIKPPSHVIRPYIPRGLEGILKKDAAAYRKYLTTLLTNLSPYSFLQESEK